MRKWWQKYRKKLSGKFQLVIFNEETYEKVSSLNFRLRNISMLAALIFLMFFMLTFTLIAYTPLKVYVPGFEEMQTNRQLSQLLIRTDSLESTLKVKRDYIEGLRSVFREETPISEISHWNIGDEQVRNLVYPDWDNDDIRDSLRNIGLNPDQYRRFRESFEILHNLSSHRFHEPVQGIVTSPFDVSIGHFATDIVAPEGTPIFAALDGKVVLAEWSDNTGYVLVLQHPGNLLTIYKHNEQLLRQAGEFVRAGEEIAIIGGSGEFATGPHLHFELWYKGQPINPEYFFAF
jgi:murein DD-endopeptidase MepM/ murein hydrolase activator NlpD